MVGYFGQMCFSIKMGLAPELYPDPGGYQEKIQMTNLTIPTNFSFIKYAEKSVPGLADVGAPHGGGDGPRIAPKCMRGLEKVAGHYSYYA